MKNLVKSKRAEGFTIIEVMIVLAIAGLIMVIVFLAVPQLQRNQRDNARQSIANRVKAEIETYAGNNQGVYPFKTGGSGTGDISDFVSRYVDTEGGAAMACNDATQKVNSCDPSTGNPVMKGTATTSGQPISCGANANACTGVTPTTTAGDFYVVYSAKCDGENLVNSGGAPSTSTRNFAVLYVLDRGNHYCVDNG
jgi:prepilin-type N-terminal cleavage/methylation domain-containing protein